MERFVPKNDVKKIGFPIVFSKSYYGGGEEPNTPKYAKVLVVTCTKLNFVTALLSPPPIIGAALQIGSYIYVRAGTECLHLDLLREREKVLR